MSPRTLVLVGAAALTLSLGAGLLFTSAPTETPAAQSLPTGFAKPAKARVTDGSPEAPSIPAALALKQRYTLNQSAFVPPQCYTKTTDAEGRVHNPCYTCHVASRSPNFINDAEVQLEYAFVPRARNNAWQNIFVDWTSRIAEVSDESILAYIRTSNYFDEKGAILLAEKLRKPPEMWDHGEDGVWSGFVPDAWFAFDDRGFDKSPNGDYSGWRAFAYYPVPGTFWPTNGSMGDVLIRLPAPFRERVAGTFDRQTYEVNLAIVESVVTRKDVPIETLEEAEFGVDLDQDGQLGKATSVRFRQRSDADYDEKSAMSYVGLARGLLERGELHLGEGLYPEGTEFLHSLRYLDPTETGITLAARMKELRYARKAEWFSVAQLDKRAKVEAIAKEDSPSELRNFGGDIERGVSNTQGWFFQGFIEDQEGSLRPQTFEETTYCTGCHGGVGVTDDGIFSFSRRLGGDAFQDGWYHWSKRGLEGVPDRAVHGGSSTEYVTYLEQNGAGDEFRQNGEVQKRFFDAKGELLPEMKARVQRDVSVLLLPSKERALALDKAYRLLVKDQSFRLGREIVLDGAREVHQRLDEGQTTGIERPVEPPWSAQLHAVQPASP
jgi:hypothetical protein